MDGRSKRRLVKLTQEEYIWLIAMQVITGEGELIFNEKQYVQRQNVVEKVVINKILLDNLSDDAKKVINIVTETDFAENINRKLFFKKIKKILNWRYKKINEVSYEIKNYLMEIERG